MPNDKVKFYKNSERNKPEVRKAYVPQYQVMGVEPEEFISPSQKKDSTITKKPVSLHEARTHVKTVQPYAKMVQSPIGHGRGLVPNVGNNMEHTWSSVDGEIIDNISDDFTIIDNDQQMIDNNEIVTSQALGIKENLEQTMNNEIMKSSLPEEGYSLFVLGNFVASGSLELIQNQVRELVFGEHASFLNKPVAIEDIVVFKIQQVKIKVGVFLE